MIRWDRGIGYQPGTCRALDRKGQAKKGIPALVSTENAPDTISISIIIKGAIRAQKGRGGEYNSNTSTDSCCFDQIESLSGTLCGAVYDHKIKLQIVRTSP